MATFAAVADTRPSLTEAYSFLVDTCLVTRWFDIFVHLGIDRATLSKSFQDHPFDARLSLFDMLKLWIERDHSPATWEALIHVIRFKLLEGKIANKMARRYCPESCSNDTGSDSEDNVTEDPFSAALEEDSFEFSKALLNITEKLPELSFIEFYQYLKELRCPDGTRIIDKEDLKDRRTCDGLILPIVCSSLCNCRDVDFLVHILTVLGHEDLLSILRDYVPKIGMGNPSDASLQDPAKFFAVKPVLNPAIKRVDLAVVSLLKQTLCACFDLSERPYLIQFTGGWTADPIKLCFQLPLSCSDGIEERIAANSSELATKGIIRIEVEINTTIFTYPVV